MSVGTNHIWHHILMKETNNQVLLNGKLSSRLRGWKFIYFLGNICPLSFLLKNEFMTQSFILLHVLLRTRIKNSQCRRDTLDDWECFLLIQVFLTKCPLQYQNYNATSNNKADEQKEPIISVGLNSTNHTDGKRQAFKTPSFRRRWRVLG